MHWPMIVIMILFGIAALLCAGACGIGPNQDGESHLYD